MTRLVFVTALLIAICMPAVATGQPQEEVIYFHTDAVGSVRMITDASGQVIARYDYLPFGEQWPADPTLPETRQFTGQERDAGTGFDYFSARYFASGNGRFTTPDDPAFINLFDPQSTNRYAYAYNNPLGYVDPTGHAPEVRGEFSDESMVRFYWESLTRPLYNFVEWRMDQERQILQQNSLFSACTTALGFTITSMRICEDFGFEPVVTESGVGAGGRTFVYVSRNLLSRRVQYVGITNNLARRAAEHLASKGIRIQQLMKGLSRSDAHAVEQALMQTHGLGKHGGTLTYNLVNSIAESNPVYAQQVARGFQLLRSIGYK